MNRNKRGHDSSSEESDFEELETFYNDEIDFNDSFSSDELDSDDEDPFGEAENCAFNFEFNDPVEDDDYNFNKSTFYNDQIDFNDSFSSDEQGDEDPLEELDSNDEDPLGEAENCAFNFEFNDPVEDDDYNFKKSVDVYSCEEFESESESDTDDTDEKEATVSKACDVKVKWTNVPANFVPRKKIPTYKETEMRVEEDSTPVELFFKLFPKKLFERIAKYTNERLDILAAKKCIEVQHTDWNEIVLVVGCLLVMGYNRLPQMQMYWSNNPTLGNKAIKNAITRDRFLLLASKLYFNHPVKPKGADRLYYMEKLVKCLKYTFKRARTESTYQSIDETMVKFKGRWAGKQYMPNKRPKRGAKIWTRSDAMSGYCYDFNIYKGKEEGPAEGTLGERVVIKLSSTIGDEDVVICTDRFFTSYQLMKTLPFACVGTCMFNRKNVPVIKDKLKKGESVSQATADGIVGFKWQDTKEVLLMSNCHDDSITTVERKQKDGTKKTVSCPEAISFYNKYMGGVDMTDQYTVLYDIDRKSTKWWKRVFQRLLMTAITNAWVIYKQLEHKKIPLIDMLVPLAEDLIEVGKAGAKVQRNSKNGRPSKKAKLFVNVQHLPAPSTSRRCRLCSKKNIEKRTKFVCTTCEIPLCAACFLPYHQ